MSSWAVFGAVMDQEDFCRSMSDEEYSKKNQSATFRSRGPVRPQSHHVTSASRYASPDRPIFEEPVPFANPSPQTPEAIDPHVPSEADASLWPTTRTSWLNFQTFAAQLTKILPSSFRDNIRVILKCSIAYLIASLFSFYDPLSDLLVLPFGVEGPFSGAHVVATIVTYYRPAATVGAMMQANHHALWGLLWLAVLIVGSTMTSVLIHNRIISHAIILIVFVGFGYGTMSWVKQKSPGYYLTAITFHSPRVRGPQDAYALNLGTCFLKYSHYLVHSGDYKLQGLPQRVA